MSLPKCPMCQSEYTYEDRGLLICPECGHEWSPFGRKLLEGQGCPHCNILSKTKTNEDFVNELKVINPYIEPLEEYVNSNTKMLFRCKIEGYEWRTTPAKVLSRKGCPCCAGWLPSSAAFGEEINSASSTIISVT